MQALKPQLHEKEEESAALLARVTQEQADAQTIRQAVAAEEADIAARTQETEVPQPPFLSDVVDAAASSRMQEDLACLKPRLLLTPLLL